MPTGQKKRALAADVLMKTEVTLRQSVDGMAQAVSEFEKLSQLASTLAQDTSNS
jgi:hypothetical protein